MQVEVNRDTEYVSCNAEDIHYTHFFMLRPDSNEVYMRVMSTEFTDIVYYVDLKSGRVFHTSRNTKCYPVYLKDVIRPMYMQSNGTPVFHLVRK